VFGRFFCGWACHIVAYQDLAAWLLGKVGLRPRAVRSRLLAFVPLGVGLWLFGPPLWRRLQADGKAPELVAQFTTTDPLASFPGLGMTVLTFLIVGGVMVWWLGAKGFCTYACPYGGIMAVLDRFSPSRIVVSDACNGCGHCTAGCTSNVRVHEEVKAFGRIVDSGCMKCFDCVSGCPQKALSWSFAKPALWTRPARTKVHDFDLREEVLMLVVFAVALFAFHGLYRLIHPALAVALAVLMAAMAVLIPRLLHKSTVSWQRLTLKASGRLTRHGVAAVLVIGTCVSFTAHSGLVQYHRHRATTRVLAAASLSGSERQDEVCAARAHLLACESLSMVYDADVDLQLAVLANELGYRDEAISRTRMAIAHEEHAHARAFLAVLERGGRTVR
jgi:polyferredoxin